MSDLEQQLGDMLADGRITLDDAHEVRTFQQFLAESGPPPLLNEDTGKRAYPAGHPLHDLDALRAHLERWGPYMRGEADGPIETSGGEA